MLLKSQRGSLVQAQEIVGTWTPTISFVTPGDLSVVYSTRVGQYRKCGRLVDAWFRVVTSTFTHTTASGNLTMITMPFTRSMETDLTGRGTLAAQGITKAGYSQFGVEFVTPLTLRFGAFGSGQSAALISASDMPSGGTVLLNGHISYLAAE